MADYTWTGPSGPSAAYQGDPNDYSTSSGGFDWSSFASGAFNFAGDLLNFGSTIYGINKTGQPAPNQNGTTYPQYYPQQQQAVAPSNTGLYIGISILALLVLVVLIYLFTRKAKA